MQLPERLILGLVSKADHAYFTFQIPKKSGGTRLIHHPSRELKALQRWLLYQTISQWEVHDAAHAYRPGRSIKDNARVHAPSRYLLRMDLADFFPSIRMDDVRAFLTTHPEGTAEWTDEDRDLFCRMVCRSGQLTIGAPTSPALSNAICQQLDRRLATLAEAADSRYTRYADDLFFSTQRPNILGTIPEQVTNELAQLDCPGHLTINAEKTRHSSKRGRRQVTGLVLSSDGSVRVGRARKRYIRRQVHRFEALTGAERSELAGLIAFAMDVEPDIVNALIIKYGADAVARARQGG